MVRFSRRFADRFRRQFGHAPALAALALCLAAPLPAAAADDPLEPFNRAMFNFNRALVTKVINPTVDTIGPHTPDAVKVSLHNAYSNLTEIEFLLNGALRRDLNGMAVPAGRFVVNSTLGVAGLFDVATPLGLERRETDFIESLCQTGLPPGPYLVLPLVGSANVNSAAALAGGVALEVYALSFISTTLAAADFIIIDLGGAASGLRYMNTAAEAGGSDPYATLRDSHTAYVTRGCGATSVAATNEPSPFRRVAAPGGQPLPRTLVQRVAP